jgi:hypothetical protein
MNMEKQERYRNIRRKPKEKRVEFETESWTSPGEDSYIFMNSLCKDVSNLDYIASSIGSLVNNKYERIWKETFRSNLRYFVDIYLEGRGKNHKNISQDRRCSDRESKRVKGDSVAAWVNRTYYMAWLYELLPVLPPIWLRDFLNISSAKHLNEEEYKYVTCMFFICKHI